MGGATVNIVAIRDPHEKLDKMIALKLQCDEAECSYPQELVDYFSETGREMHDNILDLKSGNTAEGLRESMVERDLEYGTLSEIEGLTEGRSDNPEGMVIDLEKLPSEFKKLRIYLTY